MRKTMMIRSKGDGISMDALVRPLQDVNRRQDLVPEFRFRLIGGG